MRERETEHHRTAEEAQTFNPETFSSTSVHKKDKAGGQCNHLREI